MSRTAVLIVAEDEQVAGLVRDILNSDGLSSFTAPDLYAIAELIGRANLRPCAAIIDASVWRIDEVAQICEAACPGLPLLILSDYVADQASPAVRPSSRVLRKPFSPALFLSALHALTRAEPHADASRA